MKTKILWLLKMQSKSHGPLFGILMGAFLVFGSSGCLKTRSDVKETETKQVLQRQVIELQRTNADAGGKVSEMEEQLRYLNGRVEVVENKLGRGDGDTDKKIRAHSEDLQDAQKKISIHQEALVKMENQLAQLSADVAALRAEVAAQTANQSAAQATRDSGRGGSRDSKKNHFDMAEDFFKQKEWNNSIIEFQKYRDNSPKGKNFPEATYKIGVSFQELGKKDEAKIFYQEVIERFPNSDEARKARTRLKNLK